MSRMSVGRNDPCPCGSGRKYKNCCMRRERVQASQMHSDGLLANALRAELYDFAVQPRYNSDVETSFEVFWAGHYAPDAAQELDQDSVNRWLEWYAHEFRIGEDRRRPIDLFAEARGTTLPEDLQPLLQAWRESLMGLYRVERVQEDRLAATDLLREEPQELIDPVMARNARPRDLLVARTYRLDDGLHLSTTTLLLPPDYEPGLTEFVRNAYRGYVEEHGRATWEEFLRADAHIFMAFLLSPKGDHLRALVGQGTRYSDPARTRDRLRAFTARWRVEREAEARQAEERPPERRTASGIILPGAEAENGESAAAPAGGGQASSRPTILIPGRDL